MKIIYGITKSNFGGAQRYVFDLAGAAKERGYDVAVVCGKEGKLTEKLRAEKIRVIVLDNLERDISLIKEFKSFAEIVKILKKETPDVFHTNSSKMGGLGSLAGRIVGTKKIIFTGHGWAFNEPRPLWQKVIIKFFTWLTILLSHKTICVSEETKRQISGLWLIKNKLTVIHNGISGFEINQRDDKSFTVGVIAELHKIKGLDILLEAWRKFVKHHKAKLVISGEGEERQNLENMAKNLDISDSVIFKGFINNARALLSNVDLFCMPSRSEAMPYALLEAGIAGLPVIATAVGGIPEIIESGVNGVLIPPEDSESILSSLILLYDNPGLRKRLGLALKETVEHKFSFEKMVKQTLKLYS